MPEITVESHLAFPRQPATQAPETSSASVEAMRAAVTAMKSAVGETEWLHSRTGITTGDCGVIRLLRTSIAALSSTEKGENDAK